MGRRRETSGRRAAGHTDQAVSVHPHPHPPAHTRTEAGCVKALQRKAHFDSGQPAGLIGHQGSGALGAENWHPELEHPGVAGVLLLLAKKERVSKVSVPVCEILGGMQGVSGAPFSTRNGRLSGTLFLSGTFFSLFPCSRLTFFPRQIPFQLSEKMGGHSLQGPRDRGREWESRSPKEHTWSLNSRMCVVASEAEKLEFVSEEKSALSETHWLPEKPHAATLKMV